MSTTINGVYRNGQVVLEKLPEGIAESPVRVEFLQVIVNTPQRGFLSFGKYFKSDGPISTMGDFDAVKKSLLPKAL